MAYEKFKDEIDELLKHPWELENEQKIMAVLNDESTPKDVVFHIINRYEELTKEIALNLENEKEL